MKRVALVAISFCILAAPIGASAFTVTWGDSWDNYPLQAIFDAEFGPGVINAATDYEGYSLGDADPGYWEDGSISGLIVREIAGFRNRNTMGWYAEDLSGPPIIDGIDDGVFMEGGLSEGESVNVTLPSSMTRFGFYLNPNGDQAGGGHAPEPELFFTNRFYNDLGTDGSGSPHEPFDGDPQCLVYNITHLNDGIPTYILAWEDLDYGGPITPGYTWTSTDNDYNDCVVVIQAQSPVQTEQTSLGSIKAMFSH